MALKERRGWYIGSLSAGSQDAEVTPEPEDKEKTVPLGQISPLSTLDELKESLSLLNTEKSILGCLQRTPTIVALQMLEKEGTIATFPYKIVRASCKGFDGRAPLEGGCLIGTGGFSQVFQGLLQGVKVAVKQLTLEAEANRQQFRTELQILAGFKHPNLISVIGFSFDGPEFCILYEFAANGSLQDRLAKLNGTPPIPWTKRVAIAKETARGFCYLHSHGDFPMIHRDLKSANILLDENLTAKVSDFGLVHRGCLGRGSQVIKTVNIVGTTTYMAPEAFHFDVSVKLDSFSYGVILLELWTGLPPVCERTNQPDLVGAYN